MSEANKDVVPVELGGDSNALCMFCRCRAGVIGLLPGGYCVGCEDYGAVLVVSWEGAK